MGNLSVPDKGGSRWSVNKEDILFFVLMGQFGRWLFISLKMAK